MAKNPSRSRFKELRESTSPDLARGTPAPYQQTDAINIILIQMTGLGQRVNSRLPSIMSQVD